jgi:hypothetical protein
MYVAREREEIICIRGINRGGGGSDANGNLKKEREERQ